MPWLSYYTKKLPGLTKRYMGLRATGVARAALVDFGKASVRVPSGFEIHPRLQRHVKRRIQTLDAGKDIDWATAEVRPLVGVLWAVGYEDEVAGCGVWLAHGGRARHPYLGSGRRARDIQPTVSVCDAFHLGLR